MRTGTMICRTGLFRTLVFVTVLGAVFPAAMTGQTAPGTEVRNQARGLYQYRSFPQDTARSNPVQFTVLAAPNFSISFGARDTMVFGKETLQVRLVYTNIGNQTADSAVVTGVLPPAGLSFVPGSTGGSVSGNTVTWRVKNIAAGQSDSVGVKVVVDSTLLANTQLQVEGNIEWLSTSTNALTTFVVSSFPRLDLSIVPNASFVGSGRTIVHQLVVRNSGNLAAAGVTVMDTLSADASYVSASPVPDSIRAGGKVLVWKLGTLGAFQQTVITLTESTPPNLASGTVRNSATAFASNIAASAAATSVVPILPVAPKSIQISAVPPYIFGQLGLDSALVTVRLKDSLAQSLPDGVPVQFTTARGSFSNGAKSRTVTLQNGSASLYLRPENVTNDIIRTAVTAVGGAAASGTVTDSAEVLIYPGAVGGTVVNGLDRVPFAGAIARVYNQTSAVVGADTTGTDGKFFVPLNKDVSAYRLEIFVVDKFGDTVITNAAIDPTQFPKPPIQIPNTISGRIQYRVSGLPVPAEGITVFLDSVSTAGGRTARRAGQRNLPAGVYARVQEQQTDALGRFKFENLRPARYIVSVDSTQFPSYKGYSFVSDTVSGTFTINLSIEIEQDSTVTFSVTGPSAASAGDTVRYTVGYTASGNLNHYNVTVTDTLPPFTSFVSAEQGAFKSVAYDSSSRVVRWAADSIVALQSDSVRLALKIAGNIPDSTRLRATAWFNSTVRPSFGATAVTTVRSLGTLAFGNVFQRDSIIAGDSLSKRLWFVNTGTDSLKNLVIVDSLFSGGGSRIALSKSMADSVAVADSIITVSVGALAPGEGDTLTFTLYTDFTLPPGTRIRSNAHVMQGATILTSLSASVTMVENSAIAGYLKVTKTANKKSAEIGDVVTYQVQVSNTSPLLFHTLAVYDLMPHAFTYVRGSARFNGRPSEPVMNPSLNGMTWNLPDSLDAGKSGMLVYQLAVGADAMESQGMNTAYAGATAGAGFRLLSAAAQWQVTIRPGVFTEKGLIIGKVFYDDNRNTFQEPGEDGIKGVELWMEDGTKITTGDDGKYSLPEVRPGQHVIRLNERTLPRRSSLLPGSTKFAGDPGSQFVRLTESGIAKANFFIARNIADTVRQSAGKMNRLLTVAQAVPKYVYRDTVQDVRNDTVDIIVSFVFSGARYLQTIEANQVLPSAFQIVPGSATYNGRKVTPVVYNNNVQWKLGRAQLVSGGTLRYKAYIASMPKPNTTLLTSTVVKVMTVDSVFVESRPMVTENIVRDVETNAIESSEVLTAVTPPSPLTQMGDTVTVSEGDEVMFRIALYIDPKKEIRSVRIIDSLETEFFINERSFTLNGMPLPSRHLSVRVRSSGLSARMLVKKEEIDFQRIAKVDITELVRKGMNEITFTARLNAAVKDTVFRKTVYASVVNVHNEETVTRSNDLAIVVNASKRVPAVAVETNVIDRPKKRTRIEEKVAEAVKLVEALNQTSTRSVVMEGITFEAGKSLLTADAKVVLDNIASSLQANPDIRIQVNGHTDNTGNAAANRRISLDRAKAVRAYLISKGVQSDRLFAQGFGPDRPIATNKTEEGRAKNRRVEFSRIRK